MGDLLARTQESVCFVCEHQATQGRRRRRCSVSGCVIGSARHEPIKCLRGRLDLTPYGVSSFRIGVCPIPDEEVSGDHRLLQRRPGALPPCRQAARRDRERSQRTRATTRPATRRIPTTIQPQGVDDVEVSAFGVVVGATVVVGASVVGVVGGTVVVGASVERRGRDASSAPRWWASSWTGRSSSAPRWWAVVVDGSATDGLLVGVDGDPIVVLGRLAGGFVDPEPPHAPRVSAATGEDENQQVVTPR